MSARGKRPLRAIPITAAFLIVAFAAGAAIAPSAVLATTTVQIVADVGGCFEGHQPASGTFDVTWTDKNGHVKSQFSATGSISSDWRPPRADCENHVVAFGDLIHVHVTSPDDVTHDFRIRTISSTFHRTHNRVQGTAPVTGTLGVTVGRPSLSTGSIPKTCQFAPMRDSSGHFGIDATDCVAGYDTIGGDVAVVVWNTPGGDFERLFTRAPFVQAWVGRAKVDGYLDAGTSASLELRSAGGQVRGSASPTAGLLTGGFHGTFRKDGVAVNAQFANVIHGTWEGTQTYRVRKLTVAMSSTSISGTCDPNTRYGLALLRSGNPFVARDEITDAGGSTGPLDISEAGLHPGDVISFTCMNGVGDRTALERIAP